MQGMQNMQDVPLGRHSQQEDPERQPRRPQLLSVVAPAEEQAARAGSKRAPPGELLEEKSDIKRRNKRLFGAILGTLQRFSQEEQQARTTAAAQRRAELERKAEEKKLEASRQLRQQARDEMRQLREGEVARRRETSALAACRRLEVLYATRLARADKLSSRFLVTKTGPPLYYAPGKPCHETLKLAEQQQQEHMQWKAAQMDQLEQEKAQLRAQMLQPRTRQWDGGDQASAEPEQQQEDEEHHVEVQGGPELMDVQPADQQQQQHVAVEVKQPEQHAAA